VGSFFFDGEAEKRTGYRHALWAELLGGPKCGTLAERFSFRRFHFSLFNFLSFLPSSPFIPASKISPLPFFLAFRP